MAECSLEPCPLCSAEMVIDGDSFTHPADDNSASHVCPLEGTIWRLSTYAAAWNRSASTQRSDGVSQRFDAPADRLSDPTKKGNLGAQIGLANRDRVRRYFAEHLGCTNRECASALGLSDMAVGRHVDAIREEWEGIR